MRGSVVVEGQCSGSRTTVDGGDVIESPGGSQIEGFNERDESKRGMV